MPGLMADAAADPGLRQVFRAGLEATAREELTRVLSGAAAREQARGDISAETVLHLVAGTILVRVTTWDYLADPKTGRRAEWHIECLSPHPGPRREDDAELARRYQAALTWVREQSMLVLPLEDSNTVTEPYPVPTRTMGRAAGDAAYAMGSFSLQPGEALVIAGRSSECAFWNLCLWNPFLHTYDYDRERVTITHWQTLPLAT